NGDGNIALIRTFDMFVLSTRIPVGLQPTGVAILPNGQAVYVANTGSDSVSFINTLDLTTGMVMDSAAQLSQPLGIAIGTTGEFAYVTVPGALAVIDIPNNNVSRTIPLTINNTSGGPFRVALTPDGQRAYVTDTELNVVFVVNTITNDVVAVPV